MGLRSSSQNNTLASYSASILPGQPFLHGCLERGLGGVTHFKKDVLGAIPLGTFTAW